ncbi:HlyC/CorC family transporter [Solemya velesiana gill symbiont]|uniref:Magnesium/cobalt efflux protein n=1 Tax=Solemya velesiana gill symbiont TaxID=1918948 RepID=A0A1T2KVX3_9GAMM|nr:HlyC/CorC family transporter [Solemya velesiana gill symbiont]OOZ37007.1 magnesium/cobalt efflux protein [Solemya velesiana gill symbiont]
MSDIPTSMLFGVLALLILFSAFFSGSETALMTLNRYRLRHLAKDGHKGAVRAEKLLHRPDRLIGLILLGNNFVNILASSLATVIALRLGGEGAIAIAAGLLTLVILIFAEVAPKTLAALHPERLAFPAAFLYAPLLKLLYPLVWVVNGIANAVLKRLGVSPDDSEGQILSQEELRTVVTEAGAMIPKKHQKMLLSILDLEKAAVEDIMVPRNEVDGIELEEPIEDILRQLQNSPYSRLPVFNDGIDHIVGMLHIRKAMYALTQGELTKEIIQEACDPPYFIPEGTPLNKQLLNFQRKRARVGLVVDEYGDVLGLITLGDLLEEIVGEFTTDPSDSIQDVQPQEDGSFLVAGNANVKELVRTLHWELPINGPRTINGLITEYLEAIPEPGTSLLLEGYPVEILLTQDNAVRMIRIEPDKRRKTRKIPTN